MGKGIKFGSAVCVIAAAFSACGDGEIIQSGVDEEVGLQQVLHNRVSVDDALRACLNDSLGCKLDMENAPVSEKPASSASENVEETSSATAVVTSSASTVTSNGSTADDPIIIVPVYGSSTSGENPAVTSSSGTSYGMKTVSGRCTVSPSSAEKKKGQVTYTFTQVGTTPTLETLDWLIPDDATVSSTIEGLTKTVTVTYANAGTPTAVTVVANKGLPSEGKVVTCAAPKIVGPAVTGCSCKPTLKSSSNDVKNGTVSYEWAVSGCSSIDAEGESAGPFTYSWSGTGVSGSADKVTGTYTAMGNYAATVAVTNADGTSGEFTCSEKAPVNDASWTFKCSPLNSAEFDGEEMQVKANSCYAFTYPSKDYPANLQIGTWSGVSGATISARDCNGNEIKGNVGSGSHSAMGVGYQPGKACTVYFYPSADMNLQIKVW